MITNLDDLDCINARMELNGGFFKKGYENGDPDRKRQIFRDLGSNLILKDKIVRINLEKPLEWIDKIKGKEETISPKFEPEKNGYSTDQLEAYWSKNPTLLPG